MRFINKEHEERYNDLMKRGKGVRSEDWERIPVMYILAGNESLYRKADRIYDFREGYFKAEIKQTCEECMAREVWFEVSLSSSEERLVTLAYDIFTGRDFVGVCELFRVLDRNNTRLALNAIELAYMY